VRKRAFCTLFDAQNDQFTRTGSGQIWGTLKSEAFFAGRALLKARTAVRLGQGTAWTTAADSKTTTPSRSRRLSVDRVRRFSSEMITAAGRSSCCHCFCGRRGAVADVTDLRLAREVGDARQPRTEEAEDGVTLSEFNAWFRQRITLTVHTPYDVLYAKTRSEHYWWFVKDLVLKFSINALYLIGSSRSDFAVGWHVWMHLLLAISVVLIVNLKPYNSQVDQQVELFACLSLALISHIASLYKTNEDWTFAPVLVTSFLAALPLGSVVVLKLQERKKDFAAAHETRLRASNLAMSVQKKAQMAAASKAFTVGEMDDDGKFLAGENVRVDMAMADADIVASIKDKLRKQIDADSAKDFFVHCDVNANGSLELPEFRSAIRNVNITPKQISDFELQRLFAAVDGDGSGDVSVEELTDFVWGDTAISLDWSSPADYLQGVPAFQRLSKSTIDAIAEDLKLETYAQGEVILKKGIVGTKFFVVKKGSVGFSFIDEGVKVEKVRSAPEYFGELSLLPTGDGKVTATVVAETACECLTLAKDRFDKLLSEMHSLDRQSSMAADGASLKEEMLSKIRQARSQYSSELPNSPGGE
jgi:Ca2+-binding EF-hand superfamily protein